MENIELYKKEINSIILDVEVLEDEKVKISYGDSVLTIETYHTQDCCESVFADFSIVKYFIEHLRGKEFSNLVIKGVKDMGFLLCFELRYQETVKIFVPCYNYQNGYYSSQLTLSLKDNEVTTEVDISTFVEDQID